eukprot:scaffold139241_cov36-Prasinocladus_malaysianus.AAC.1
MTRAHYVTKEPTIRRGISAVRVRKCNAITSQFQCTVTLMSQMGSYVLTCLSWWSNSLHSGMLTGHILES